MRRKHFLILGILLAALIFVKAKALAVSIVLSLLLAYLLDPIVMFMERKKVNRRLAVVVLYLLILVFTISIGIKGGGYLFNQAQSFYRDIPSYMESARTLIEKHGKEYVWVYEIMKNLDKYFATFMKKTLGALVTAIYQVVYVLIIFVISFFTLINRDRVVESLRRLIGEKLVNENSELISEVDGVLRGFFRGRIVVCLIVFILMLISTGVIRVKHAIFISLFTGLTSFIPYYGALAGLVPGIFAALGTPPVMRTVIYITVIIFVVNSIESNILTPFLTGRHIKLHPAVIILSVMIGGALYGFWGVVFSLPLAGIIKIFYTHTLRREGEGCTEP
jgi:predicted PurR-regulated permease PerM